MENTADPACVVKSIRPIGLPVYVVEPVPTKRTGRTPFVIYVVYIEKTRSFVKGLGMLLAYTVPNSVPGVEPVEAPDRAKPDAVDVSVCDGDVEPALYVHHLVLYDKANNPNPSYIVGVLLAA